MAPHDIEYSAGFYYGVHLANFLTVRPNLQYIRHPAAWTGSMTR